MEKEKIAFNSIHGLSIVEKIAGGKAYISNASSVFLELVSVEELPSHIAFCERQFASQQAAKQRNEEKQSLENALHANSKLNKYLDTLNPLQRGKVQKTLEKRVLIEGVCHQRAEYVEKLTLNHVHEKGRLINKDCPRGGYWEAEQLTKTAIDYFLFLTNNQ